MDSANFPIEDRIEDRIEGVNLPIEYRIEPETEAANFPVEDWTEPGATSREAKTLVLFGRVGNGKSAVGNSIVGKKVFLSTIRASGVTTTCKQETTTLGDGQVVNVIDTPGIFDSSRGHEDLALEMLKCINLAQNGIDGFLLVCSIRSRFSTEEESVLQSLSEIFGQNIINYMIVVFTGGDELEMTFEDYLSECPPSLQRVLHLCRYRVVLFDNKTEEETQCKCQIQQLMAHINTVADENGSSYRGDVFEMIKQAQKSSQLEKHQSQKAEDRRGKRVLDIMYRVILPRRIGDWMQSPNVKEDCIVPIATFREAKTLVLFGKVGNGKSALGNSIIGKKELFSGVTTTCKLETTTFDDGQVVNVIDTPGLFDQSREPGYSTSEMAKCISLAKDGIDGFIFVCSIRTTFSPEEACVLQILTKIFSVKIINYTIVVFTGGDELDMTFHEYLSKCPPSLQTIIQLCKNRVVLFDNKTTDDTLLKDQVQQLMSHITMVRDENGQSYTTDLSVMMMVRLHTRIKL
ncbi:hypothetical protein MKX03_037567 [Papaver bracteatum]|nr:hypothetical protein MKX03_037567 [Papaver bracteatum]